MLDINKISHTSVYEEDWKKAKLGKFSASTNGKLFGEESHKGKFTDGAMTHIENIAGEIITGKPMRPEFFTDATNYGNANEPLAIERFCEVTGKTVLRNEGQKDTHRLIIQNEREGCTPDALIPMAEEKFLFDSTGTKIKVAPLETKCPPIHHRFIKIFKCITAMELKKADKIYFYQGLTQLVYVDSLIGYFAAYNFDFTIDMRIIEFKQIELRDEVKKFNDTMHYAKIEVDKIVKMFKK